MTVAPWVCVAAVRPANMHVCMNSASAHAHTHWCLLLTPDTHDDIHQVGLLAVCVQGFSVMQPVDIQILKSHIFIFSKVSQNRKL